MTQSLQEMFVSEVEDYLEATGMAPSTFCLNAVNCSSKAVKRVRNGTVTLITADKVRAYIAANPPKPDEAVSVDE